MPQSSPLSQAEKHRCCLCRLRAAKRCSFPPREQGSEPQTLLAKCKRGIRAHVKTAYSQAVCSKRLGPIHGVIQSDSTLSLLLSDNPAVHWSEEGCCEGTWRRSLLMLAAEGQLLENSSFPLREKLSTFCWQHLHARSIGQVLTMLWLRSLSGYSLFTAELNLHCVGETSHLPHPPVSNSGLI